MHAGLHRGGIPIFPHQHRLALLQKMHIQCDSCVKRDTVIIFTLGYLNTVDGNHYGYKHICFVLSASPVPWRYCSIHSWLGSGERWVVRFTPWEWEELVRKRLVKFTSCLCLCVRMFVTVFHFNSCIICCRAVLCGSAPKTNSSTKRAMDSSHMFDYYRLGNFCMSCIKIVS
jgi:hypothetical protein